MLAPALSALVACSGSVCRWRNQAGQGWGSGWMSVARACRPVRSMWPRSFRRTRRLCSSATWTRAHGARSSSAGCSIFGYRYDYRARAVSPDACLGPLLECLRAVSGRLVSVGVLSGFPDQVIANEYLPGQGIRAHIDCVPCFGERIVSLSLLSPCEMVFRQKQSGEKLAVPLGPRSVLAMTGPARYQWTHEIPARLSDRVDGAKVARARRISLTFRTVVKTA